MSSDNPVEQGKAAIIGELVKEVSTSPKIREAGAQLASAALTVTKTINVCLLPLAALNFGYEKARQYFQGNFVIDLEEKIAEIPVENIIEPKPSIAGPALQGLAFALDEPSLKTMYLNLIATAMDGRISNGVHPSFTEILRQINSEEARLLHSYLTLEAFSPVVEVRIFNPQSHGWNVVIPHLFNYCFLESRVPVESEAMSAMIDNFMRLGLISVQYGSEVKVEGAYDWVENRPEVMRLRDELEVNGKRVECCRGTIGRTAFGKSFALAVGII